MSWETGDYDRIVEKEELIWCRNKDIRESSSKKKSIRELTVGESILKR
jgi:hypothetical protein